MFAAGTEVIVLSLGRRTGIVHDVGRDGRYHVQVGGLMLWCRDGDLAALPAPKRRRPRSTPPREEPLPAATAETVTIDLHGLTAREARAALYAFLAQSGLARLRFTGCRVPVAQRLGEPESTVHGWITAEDGKFPSRLYRAFCALADGAVSPIQSSLKHFRAEYEQHIGERRCPFTGIGPGTETAAEPVTESAFTEAFG